LITHHAAWLTTDAHLAGQKYDRLRELGINLYVAHDCLDVARDFGTGDALARGVRVAVQGPFKPDGEQGFGVHGVTTGQFDEFVTRVGSQLGIEPRAWKNCASFGHVGIVAGWGGRPEWMARAQELGCDTFLTGEAGMFGILFAQEAGLNLVIAGHYATEAPGVMSLSARIARDLQLEVTFIPEEIVEARG
jgi:putative NIF3 family GTP cyclohydrolase 1 type 2